jgi:hypothetical protein
MSKLEYLKQNWVIALIWNAPMAFIAFIIIHSITDDIYPNIFLPIFTLVFLASRDMHNWHMEDRIDKLEKEIKKLKE